MHLTCYHWWQQWAIACYIQKVGFKIGILNGQMKQFLIKSWKAALVFPTFYTQKRFKINFFLFQALTMIYKKVKGLWKPIFNFEIWPPLPLKQCAVYGTKELSKIETIFLSIDACRKRIALQKMKIALIFQDGIFKERLWKNSPKSEIS